MENGHYGKRRGAFEPNFFGNRRESYAELNAVKILRFRMKSPESNFD